MDSLYQHPSFYDMLHHERSSDLAFYLAATEGRAHVLEYGIGSGRVAIPMARRGQRIIGIDLSPQMLATSSERLADEPAEVQARVRLVRGDARQLALNETFDAITCPFNGLSHHHEAEQLEAFFDRVRQHLRPDGVFVFDVAIPDPRLLAGTSSDIPWFRDPVDGTVCRATERIEYDPLHQILTIVMTSRAMEGEREPQEMVLHLRQFFPAETLLLLRHHGFEVLRRNTDLGDVLGYVCQAR